MTPRELIAEAWQITTKYKRKLLPWGAADAFILMIAAIAFVMYQGYVLSVFFRTELRVSWVTVLQKIHEFFGSSAEVSGLLIVIASIYGLLWLLIPRMAAGALIGLAAKIYCGDEPKGGLVLGVYNFPRLLELSAALGLISGRMLISGWSLVVRYMGGNAAIFATTAFLLVLWVLSFLLHFLFTFAEESIVIRKIGVFRALGQSFKLVISYLSKVVLIFILLLVIILRIIANAVIIFLIPSIVMGVGLGLARFLPEIVSFGISGLLGLVALGFASYFLGYVTVFKHTVWTITYLELSKEKDLDVIVPDEKTEESTEQPQENIETPEAPPEQANEVQS